MSQVNFSELKASATHILTTPFVDVTAWEKSSGWGKHGASASFDDANGVYIGRYGQISTRSAECDLPVGPERTAAVKAHYDTVAAWSRAVVAYLVPEVRDLPDTVKVRIDGGSLALTFPTVQDAQDWATKVTKRLGYTY